MAELLTDDDIASRLRGLPWEREDDEIVREWRFEDFAAAIAFVNRVAEAAEEANRHPDISIHGWNKVKLPLSNHSAGGLTEVDFTMAADSTRSNNAELIGVMPGPAPSTLPLWRSLLLPLGGSLNDRRRPISK